MLRYHPSKGEILICDYSGFRVPEMVKTRPVVVISPRFRSHNGHLCLVVPLSTTEPKPIEKFHMKIKIPNNLPTPFDSNEHWIKTDMINTVSLNRLSKILLGKNSDGTRRYLTKHLDQNQTAELEAKIKLVFGIKDI